MLTRSLLAAFTALLVCAFAAGCSSPDTSSASHYDSPSTSASSSDSSSSSSSSSNANSGDSASSEPSSDDTSSVASDEDAEDAEASSDFEDSEDYSDDTSVADASGEEEYSSEHDESVEELSEAEIDEETSEEETEEQVKRIVALVRQLQAAQARSAASADAARKAACVNALTRLNAHLSNTAAVLGDSNGYYIWETAFRQLQVEVNTKCKARPGEATIYPYAAGGGSSTTGTSVESMRARDRARDAFNERRLQAIRSGADPRELPKNPYQ